MLIHLVPIIISLLWISLLHAPAVPWLIIAIGLKLVIPINVAIAFSINPTLVLEIITGYSLIFPL